MQPCKLRPAVKDYLWGGRRLIDDYHVKATTERVAEAWMLSCHPDGCAIIDSGPDAGRTLAEILNEQKDVRTAKLSASAFPVIMKLSLIHI